jgi:DNA-binding transcriptional regulator YiaG
VRLSASACENPQSFLLLCLRNLYVFTYRFCPKSAGKVYQHPPGYHKHSGLKHHVHDNQKPIERTMSAQPKEREGIAARIKAKREQGGLSQSQAAQKWGVSKRTLQEWEQGRSNPRGLYLQAIERILSEAEGRRK